MKLQASENGGIRMRVVLQDNEGQVRKIVWSLTKNTVEPEQWYVGRVELRGEDISKDGGYRVSFKQCIVNFFNVSY